MKPAQFAALGLAMLIAAFIIGLTNPKLVEGGAYDDVTCGVGWGGSTSSNATESGESDCAQIRSGRMSWSVSLAFLGGGLLVCALIAGSGKRPDGPPLPYPAPEFGRKSPPPPPPGSDPSGPSAPQQGPPVVQ